MHFTDRRTSRRLAASLLLALPLTSLGWPSADAASVPTLVAQAEHNTNTVRTLIHHDQQTSTSKSLTVKITAQGSEDEVHNREHDSEAVSLTAKATNGQMRTLHYTVDLIFMNGLTYYRTSLAKNTWKTKKGMAFTDPVLGTAGWKRGRTTVSEGLTSFPTSSQFRQVGSSGGEIHVQAPYQDARTKEAGTINLWISGDKTPYVVREVDSFHTTSGAAATFRSQVSFGPFNTPLVIVPPSTGGST